MNRIQRVKTVRLEFFVVLVLIMAIASTSAFTDQKLILLNLFFLPVIISGIWIGTRGTIFGAILCISLAVLSILHDPDRFAIAGNRLHFYFYFSTWGGLLVLAGIVVGKQRDQLQSDATQSRQIYEQLAESNQSFEEARAATILGLAKLAEYRDNETGAHIERMREYVRILARELSNHPKYQNYITNNYINDLYESSILHDIGKVAIPDKVLRKRGRLNMLEYEVIMTHTTLGGDALKAVEAEVKGQSFLTIATEIAYYHHEKWDGSGYPKGLKGQQIPLSARITALADVFDALTSKRIYKAARSLKQTKAMILDGKGSHFDPDVVDAFEMRIKEFAKVRESIKNTR